MNKSFSICWFLVFFILFNTNSYSQEDTLSHRPLKKNIVHGDAAIWLIWNTANIYAERIIFDKVSETHVTNVGIKKVYYSRTAIFFRSGFGGYIPFYDGSGSYLLGEFGLLTGLENHFELSLGGTYFLSGLLEDSLLPSGSIGYRYQSPRKNIVSRIGVGFPQSVYFGFGFSF